MTHEAWSDHLTHHESWATRLDIQFVLPVFLLIAALSESPYMQRNGVLLQIRCSTGLGDHSRPTVGLVTVLWVCVLVQMLGTPVTLLSLLMTSDMLTESVSEDSSMLPLVPELSPSKSLRLRIDGQSTFRLPVLATSIFHPPELVAILYLDASHCRLGTIASVRRVRLRASWAVCTASEMSFSLSISHVGRHCEQGL